MSFISTGPYPLNYKPTTLQSEQKEKKSEPIAMSSAQDLDKLVQQQGELIKKLKLENKPKDEVEKEVQKLKELKAKLEEASEKKEKEKNPFNRSAIEDVLQRKFFYRPAFDIYGGVAGLFDLGPPGCAVQSNIINYWRRHFVLEENMLELDCTIMTKYDVFKTSGHVDRFTDLMVRDLKTNDYLRADHLLEDHLEKLLKSKDIKQQEKDEIESWIKKIDDLSAKELSEVMKKYNVKSSTGNDISEPVPFNLMFGTQIGPTGYVQGFLRPETAQGMFTNFKFCLEYNNGNMPFAAAQIGRSFRNEISPKQGLLRVREFTMAEIEHFVDPKNKSHPKFKDVADLVVTLYPAPPKENPLQERVTIRESFGNAVAKGIINNETLGYFLGRVYLFLTHIGIKDEFLRFRQHGPTEMAHYASDCWDAEIFSSYGWIECVGCADRSCYDLERHEAVTKKGLFAQEKLDTPITTEALVVESNMGQIGKVFKQKAQAIKEYLGGLTQEQLASLAKDLESGESKINVAGEEFVVKSDFVKVKKVSKTTSVREFTPAVIEPSFGIGRILYSLLEHSFWVREGDEQRSVLSFRPSMAPVKCLVAPLSNKEEFTPIVEKIAQNLRKSGVSTKADDSSSAIGRKYARADELGISFAVVVDFQTLKDGTATIRERDTATPQVRVKVEDIPDLVLQLTEEKEKWSNVLQKFPHHTVQEV